MMTASKPTIEKRSETTLPIYSVTTNKDVMGPTDIS
jgi:hypothetical protein